MTGICCFISFDNISVQTDVACTFTSQEWTNRTVGRSTRMNTSESHKLLNYGSFLSKTVFNLEVRPSLKTLMMFLCRFSLHFQCETCAPTVCNRNFLRKLSSNLHAFYFLLSGEGVLACPFLTFVFFFKWMSPNEGDAEKPSEMGTWP